MSLSVTLADANILISRTLRDYFVYAAKLGALDIHWSETILDETTRNLIKSFGFTPDSADVLVERLEAYLTTALVEVKKRDEDRVAKVEMDAKDRHVLAATLSAKADVLLTQNVGHFPREWMAKHGVELVDAGTLLLRSLPSTRASCARPTAEASIHAHRPRNRSSRSWRTSSGRRPRRSSVES